MATYGDRILIAALTVAALVAWPLVAGAGDAGRTAHVTGPSGDTSIDLGTDRTLTIEGEAGGLEVEVADGAIRVSHAECPDEVCVRTGWVDTPGMLIACVPNRVVIVVGAGDADGYDARIR